VRYFSTPSDPRCGTLFPQAMKLIGVELTNFACFERQFVPLRPGITLLVGRNNAGKTAILRALSVLGTLPVGDSKPAPAELGGYCRTGSSDFEFEIIYKMEESDAKFFQFAPQTGAVDLPKILAAELEEKEAIARWRFKVLKPNGLVGFLGCNFELRPTQEGKREGSFLARNGNGQLLLRRLQFPELVANVATQLSAASLFAAPDGSQYPVFLADDVSAPLRTFGTVKLIDPHRVVMNRQLLQTTSTLPSNAQTLGPFLQTLQGNDRDAFEKIEAFVTKVFPEFRHLASCRGGKDFDHSLQATCSNAPSQSRPKHRLVRSSQVRQKYRPASP